MALASILSGDTVTGQGRAGRVVALDEAHAMYLISTVRKPVGRAVTPGGAVQFSEGSPAKFDKGQPCCLVDLQGGRFEMRCYRRYRRSMALFDQRPIMTLGDGP